MYLFQQPLIKLGAMLKMTDVRLVLISDIYMYQFTEMRGGVSYIAQGYSKASNRYMKLFDANNLYGCVMTQYLPTVAFKW